MADTVHIGILLFPDVTQLDIINDRQHHQLQDPVALLAVGRHNLGTTE